MAVLVNGPRPNNIQVTWERITLCARLLASGRGITCTVLVAPTALPPPPLLSRVTVSDGKLLLVTSSIGGMADESQRAFWVCSRRCSASLLAAASVVIHAVRELD